MKETIKALREKYNYSQATVAKYLNISRQMYIKYESGEAEPPIKIVVGLSRLYKVDYSQIIENKEIQNGNTSYNNNYNEENFGELTVSSPTATLGSTNNNFELAKTLIPKLNIFEKLQMLSLLASSISKNGANEINNFSKSKTMSDKEKNELFQKFSGCLKDSKIQDSKDAKLEHLSPEEYLSKLL